MMLKRRKTRAQPKLQQMDRQSLVSGDWRWLFRAFSMRGQTMRVRETIFDDGR